MLSVTELRKGAIFVESGKPYVVLDYRHTKMGRGTANIKVKARDLKSGATLERTFISGATVKEGEVARKKAQFLYSDAENLNFMDPQTFEQFTLPARKVGGGETDYMKEGQEVALIYFEGEPVSIELPLKVDLKVKQAPPGEKGDTRQGGNKEVTLETGVKIQVPLFIKTGDLVRVNTQTGDYVSRV